MTTPQIIIAAVLFFALVVLVWGGLIHNAPTVEKVSQCAWCSGWYGADGIAHPDRPKVFSDPVSHGICKCCLAKEKSKLEAIYKSLSKSVDTFCAGIEPHVTTIQEGKYTKPN
jgi:hypothetical protein